MFGFGFGLFEVLWVLASAAQAATLPWWSGEWGVDPSQSDDPTHAIERAYVGPTVTGQAAEKYSPDGGGQTDTEQDRKKVLYEMIAILGVSGRMSLAPCPDDTSAISLGWGDGEKLTIVPGGKWVKVSDVDRKYRIRVFDEGDQLTVERKFVGAVVTETLVAQKTADELVVVVRIDGASLDPGVEFRRVYRSL